MHHWVAVFCCFKPAVFFDRAVVNLTLRWRKPDASAIEQASSYGVPTNIPLNNMTHLDYYGQKFADRCAQLVIEVGRSNLNFTKYPDKLFDLILHRRRSFL